MVPHHLDFLYYPIYYTFLLIIGLGGIVYLNSTNGDKLLRQKGEFPVMAWLLCVLVIVFWGLRPINPTIMFADSSGYYMYYRSLLKSPIQPWDWDQYDPGWQLYIHFCLYFKLSPQMFLLGQDVLALIPVLIGCQRMFKEQANISIIFFLASFGFTAHLYNGLRIGVAMAFIILALSFAYPPKRNILWCVVCLIIAASFHKSITLVVGSFALSYLVLRNLSFAIAIWCCCILASLLFDDFFEKYLIGMGADDKLTKYLSAEAKAENFAHIGFRWDFLLYSLWPIAFGWWLINVKKMRDKYYTVLLNTYILANSFWVLVIRANYSNRFAALSWTLYPLLLCYPYLTHYFSRKQNKWLAAILTAMLAFTLLMYLLRSR